MDIRELTREDASSVVALWTEAGLTRPWNDATADFHRALDGATSAVLGLTRDDQLMGAVMVGHDGHRGWVYYLAVAKAHQRSGVGSELMGTAEDWLRRMGAVKLQLMVRSENESVLDFYERIGYETSDVRVVSRWL
ncbi:MAG: GNAT family acetyltransferase [Acidobacteriota bacterium]|nr:GNAT family acetyltransferase [Acidobacteriota bacterium]MDE3146396.1 GNAT family acetyltransferase [Acidobacteriota bacterium]